MKFLDRLEDYLQRHKECAAWVDSLNTGIDLRGNGKNTDEYMLRYAIYYYLREHGYSYVFIGDLFNRGRSSVLHAHRKAIWFYKKEDELFMKYYNMVKWHPGLRRVARNWKGG